MKTPSLIKIIIFYSEEVLHISNSSVVRSTRLYHFEHESQNIADNVRQNVSRGHKTGNSLWVVFAAVSTAD